MYKIQKQIIDKINESQEIDVKKYTWQTIPYSLKRFWVDYYQNSKNK